MYTNAKCKLVLFHLGTTPHSLSTLCLRTWRHWPSFPYLCTVQTWRHWPSLPYLCTVNDQRPEEANAWEQGYAVGLPAWQTDTRLQHDSSTLSWNASAEVMETFGIYSAPCHPISSVFALEEGETKI